MVFGETRVPYIQQTIDSLKMANIPHNVLSGSETNRIFPKQMKIPDDHTCVFEKDAGILYAQKALHAMQVAIRVITLLLCLPRMSFCPLATIPENGRDTIG